MRNLKIGVSALAPAVLTVGTIAIANPPGRNGQQDPTPQIPKTWDDQAMATLEVPLADATVSAVPVSADYYYRIPVRPIYKTYPIYHPSKEPPGYFERLKTVEPQIVRIDSSTVRTRNDWIRPGESSSIRRRITTSPARQCSFATRPTTRPVALPVARDDTVPFVKYVIREQGKVSSALGEDEPG